MLRTYLARVLDDYAEARPTRFSEHPVAATIRREIPEALRALIGDNDRYHVRGSVGRAAWAHCPWVAVFDRLVTRSARRGYYVVYDFRADGSGVYLSLVVGAEAAHIEHGRQTPVRLQTLAHHYRHLLGARADGWEVAPIDMRAPAGTLCGLYDFCPIAARLYPADALPHDEALADDLHDLLACYTVLTDALLARAPLPDPEQENLPGDPKAWRLHRLIEQTPALVKKVQRLHPPQCAVCGFDFALHYGPIGEGFGEVHHLMPPEMLLAEPHRYHPKRDFARVCANCHRMLHRSATPDDPDAFRALYFRP